MKKALPVSFLMLFLVACTTGKVLAPEDYSLVRNVKFSKDVVRVGLLHDSKRYLIIFSSPVPGKEKVSLETIFFFPTGKEEIFLNWTETGTISEELLKYVKMNLGRSRIEDRKIIEEVLNSIYISKAFSFPYFYILGKNGRVAEIQGVDDYLRLELAARNKKLPDLSFLRQQISIGGMMDLLGIANEGSKKLGAKLKLGMPFFLAADDVISGMGIARDLWVTLTKDIRAQKLLDSAASPRDRCLLILTYPGRQLLFPSAKALQNILFTCNQYIQKEKPEGAEFVRLAKAEGRAFNVLSLKYKKKLPEKEVLQILNNIKEAQKYARNRTELDDLEFTAKLAKNALSK